MKHIKYLAGFLSFVYILLIGNYVYANNTLAPAKRMFVVEWDVVPPNEVNIPELSKIQLLGEIKKSIEAYQAFRSWQAKYHVTFRQAPQRENSIPEYIITSDAHMISNGTKWLYEIQNKTETQDQNICVISNGEVIRTIWPDENEGSVQKSEQYRGGCRSITPVNFLPYLPAESPLSKAGDFPDILEILTASDTELLSWYTRDSNQPCYVLERTTNLRHPFFRNKEELESWKKANPEETAAWVKAARYGLVFNIYPSGSPWAKPGDERVIETKVRLAIAPQLGFAIVRWAVGYESRSGPIRGIIFPGREIKYSDFLKISKDVFIPRQMVYTHYTINGQGQRHVVQETRLTVEEFAVNKQYQPKLFEFDFPVGYKMTDSRRDIIYTVGDSEEKIDALVTAAKARDDFYNKLRSEEAPELEYSKWINSKPIRLADHKGRPIILHFWGLGCAPCMHELPRLQSEYGQKLERTSAPLFISIHPFVDDSELRQLEKTIKKEGITFPVMIDLSETEGRFWGKTFRKYRVFSIPTEVKIDEKGHFAEIDKGLISTSSWWLKQVQD